MDAITQQLVQQLGILPFGKKKALLELLRPEHSPDKSRRKAGMEDWRRQLLSTSVWTESEINAMQEAREFINQWQPKQF
ncbi:hypothetical protein HUU40_26425 [candidate division KSB1 bacterium]|nr:hypothetical protein [candidate division KSB1 bacterium]